MFWGASPRYQPPSQAEGPRPPSEDTLHLSVSISSYAYCPYLVHELVKGKDYFLEYQPVRIIYA